MISLYKTIESKSKYEEKIKKSRFISFVKPVNSEKRAENFINEIREKHKDATHNVFAYTVGLESEINKYSDDGEPTGTGGRPILEIFKREKLKNVVVVVSRYFGGNLLGTGGLSRAYGQTAKKCIELAKIINKNLYYIIHITIDYNLIGKIENEIITHNQIIYDKIYTNKVLLKIYIEHNNSALFLDKLVNIANGQIDIERKGSVYLTKI